MYTSYNGAPFFYDYLNVCDSSLSPSYLKSSDTVLTNFFKKYFLQEAISIYKFRLPENWDEDYFKYTLFCNGIIGVITTDRFGTICQQGNLWGYNVFYRPNKMIFYNPLFAKIYECIIWKNCGVIKLQPNYSGIMDIIEFYATLASYIFTGIFTNLINTKLAYCFIAGNKASAQTFKKMMDDIISGEPAVVLDKDLMDSNGNPLWVPFVQNIGQNYITPKMLDDFAKIKNMFFSDIGIPNANNIKKERMLTDEINANNYETQAKCLLWLECIQKDMEKCRKLFKYSVTELSVELRPELKEAFQNESNNVNTGDMVLRP